ncbi:MAG TPA: nucleotidyltransferase domain-containing protein [Caulobacteraceae bacterium]|nr:nucleotidyltransferase domain-containing protein [Caulobacteraceae bacterium]
MTEPDPLLDALVERLQRDEACHTIILYGSRARGDAIAQSDYDVIAFRDRDGTVFREAGRWRGALIDLFIYPTTRAESADVDLIHILGGKVLVDRDGLGQRLLDRLDELHAAGPAALPADELAARRAWCWKTLDRLARGDIEGDYRRAWLLTTLLETYFVLRNAWYPGPKAAFEQLRASDLGAYALFEAALELNAPLEAIEALVERVSGPRADG